MKEENNNDKKLINSNKIVFIILAILVIILVGLSIIMNKNNEKKNEKKPHVPNEVKIDGFTYSFLKMEANKENMVYSPLSIKYALSMLNDGASGNTKDEITKVIGEEMPTKYDNIDKVLSLANSVFVRDTYKEFVENKYIDALKDKYNAELFYDNFKNADNINNWIEEKTFNIIKDMLKDSDVQNPDLEMVLVNALAIDMEWMYEFEAKNTSGKTFYKDNGEESLVAMMHESNSINSYKFFKDENYSAVTIPLKDYNGTQLEFVAVMPTDEELHSFITNDDFDSKLTNILSGLHSVNENQELSISLPRFEFDFNLNLVDDLKKLGIKDAFDDYSANFSNMSKKGLFVGDAKHKADIKLSEKGIKAAAVTVIMMFDKSAMPVEKDYVYLNFNKPFMFLIRDAKNEEVWFSGTVYEPVLWEDVKDDYDYR